MIRAERMQSLGFYNFVAHADRFDYPANSVVPITLRYDLELQPPLAARKGTMRVQGWVWMEDVKAKRTIPVSAFDEILKRGQRLSGTRTWRVEGLAPGVYAVCCKLGFPDVRGAWQAKSETHSMAVRVGNSSPMGAPSSSRSGVAEPK